MKRASITGSRIRLQDGDWTIVGTYAGGNGARESEVITDAETMMSAYKPNAVNALTVQLNDAASFEAFRQSVLHDSKSMLDAHTEPDTPCRSLLHLR